MIIYTQGLHHSMVRTPFTEKIKHQTLDTFIALGAETHNKNELFTSTDSKWVTKKDYPYAEAVYFFSILTFEQKFILFGGWNGKLTPGERLSRIARFDPAKNKWKPLGKLNKPRNRHSVVQLDNEFIIVGGKRYTNGNYVPTESCKFKNHKKTKMRCTDRKPALPTDMLSLGISN